jgi:hypothetical protein
VLGRRVYCVGEGGFTPAALSVPELKTRTAAFVSISAAVRTAGISWSDLGMAQMGDSVAQLLRVILQHDRLGKAWAIHPTRPSEPIGAPRPSSCAMFSGKQGERAMPIGLFRSDGGWVQVDYGTGTSIPVTRSKYEANGYKPDFDKLPSEAEYWAVEDKKGDDARRP